MLICVHHHIFFYAHMIICSHIYIDMKLEEYYLRTDIVQLLSTPFPIYFLSIIP